jgi:hypothetical protein
MNLGALWSAIQEFLQIHIDHHPVAVLHITLRLEHRVMRSPPRTKAIAVIRKRRIYPRLYHLQESLLDQPIRHRRYAQLAHATRRLRNLHAPHRLWPIAAVQYCLPNPRPVHAQVPRRLRNRQSIGPRTAAIGFDASPRPRHVRARERLRKQAASPQAFSSTSRRPCFITPRFGFGFTAPFPVAPRLRGLLMRGTAERHGCRLSFSFGPSPRTGSYYGLG